MSGEKKGGGTWPSTGTNKPSKDGGRSTTHSEQIRKGTFKDGMKNETVTQFAPTPSTPKKK